jgi:hypothetical protein
MGTTFMSLAPRTYLVDGPLVSAASRRAAIKNQMVLELMAAKTFASRDDARRTLYALAFFAIDIELLVDEAMAEAADFAALTAAVANVMAAA